MPALKRRHFILGTIGAVGALVVGWTVAPPRQRLIPSKPLGVAPGQVALNGWVKVSADNTVTVVMSQAEMGQGAHTGLAMLLAEEMDAAWEQIKLEQSTFDAIYNNQAAIVDSLPFSPDEDGILKRASAHLVGKLLREIPGLGGTGGSSSIKDQWLPMREAGASARAMLVAAAAELWTVPASECRAEAGRVLHPSGKSASFGELAGRAAGAPLPGHVVLKEPASFTLIGKPIRRLENLSKINGSAVYSIDVSPPDLLYASIRMCPTLGGRVARFDSRAATVLPGVRRVIAVAPVPGGLGAVGTTSGGVAVIADTPFHAMQALDAVTVEWDHGAAASTSSRAIIDGLMQALNSPEGKVHYNRGDVDTALKSASKTINAEYTVPFLAHSAMEPLNCTVQFKDGAATVWAASQAAGMARGAVAKVLGIDAEKIDVHVPYLGGSFGRRALSDFIVQAAMLARESGGAPVQLIWSREQDMTHDFYRPAYVSRCQAGFDSENRLVAWQMTSAGSSLGAPSLLDNSTQGASDTAYALSSARIVHHTVDSPVAMGIWRSVGHSQNAFFTESFVDECAAAVEQDPVAFRAVLLRGNERHLRVLHRAAELSNWGRPIAEVSVEGKRARGIAIHRAFGTIVAQVAEVSVTPEKQIHVHRVVCVVDCGIPVNPNLIRQQIEGAIVYGLSAALHGEITIEKGQVQQTNFHDYMALRLNECPAIHTEIIAAGDHPGGIGEAGTPPIAPAVANAVFSLTGQRLRSLPLRLV